MNMPRVFEEHVVHTDAGGAPAVSLGFQPQEQAAANLRTKIPDFRGFDSDIIVSFRGGILMSKGDFPERLSQPILVGIILVGRFGVLV